MRPRLGEYRTCEVCGTQKYFEQGRLRKGEGRFCSNRCKWKSHVGKSNHGEGVGHTYLSKAGYRLIRVRTGKNGYELEHRIVAQNMVGRLLATNEHVHHRRKHEKANNTEDNLQVLTKEEHARLHGRAPQKVPVACAVCGVVKYVKPSRATGERYCGNEHRLMAIHAKAKAYHARNRAEKGR
jgi:hypothetical protein